MLEAKAKMPATRPTAATAPATQTMRGHDLVLGRRRGRDERGGGVLEVVGGDVEAAERAIISPTATGTPPARTLQILAQLVHRLVALLSLFDMHLRITASSVGGHSTLGRSGSGTRARIGTGALYMCCEDPHEVVGVEGELAARHLVEDDAERIDVGAVVDGGRRPLARETCSAGPGRRRSPW
ncbi:MAG: hypothetical protein R3F14_10625 [Polyangiaceae bacterium]